MINEKKKIGKFFKNSLDITNETSNSSKKKENRSMSASHSINSENENVKTYLLLFDNNNCNKYIEYKKVYHNEKIIINKRPIPIYPSISNPKKNEKISIVKDSDKIKKIYKFKQSANHSTNTTLKESNNMNQSINLSEFEKYSYNSKQNKIENENLTYDNTFLNNLLLKNDKDEFTIKKSNNLITLNKNKSISNKNITVTSSFDIKNEDLNEKKDNFILDYMEDAQIFQNKILKSINPNTKYLRNKVRKSILLFKNWNDSKFKNYLNHEFFREEKKNSLNFVDQEKTNIIPDKQKIIVNEYILKDLRKPSIVFDKSSEKSKMIKYINNFSKISRFNNLDSAHNSRNWIINKNIKFV